MRGRLTALIAVAMMLTVFGGCAAKESPAPTDFITTMNTEPLKELDAPAVYEKMSEAVAGRCATSFTSTTDMGTNLTAGVVTMGAEVAAESDILLSEEPFCYHSDTKLRAVLFGAELAESFRVYSLRDDTGLTTYVHLDGADRWLRQRLTMVPTDLLGQYAVTRCDGNWKPENLTLAGRNEDGYVLKCTYSAEDVLHAITSPFGEISLENVDLSAVHLAVTYHIDAGTFLPTKAEIEYRGIGDVVSDVFNRYSGRIFGDFGAGMRAEVTTYREVLSDLRYDPVEVPAAPPEAAAESGEAADFNILEYIGLDSDA